MHGPPVRPGGPTATTAPRARVQGFSRLALETFSAPSAAARIYREAGFEVTWERERTDWGPPVTYQHYRLELT